MMREMCPLWWLLHHHDFSSGYYRRDVHASVFHAFEDRQAAIFFAPGWLKRHVLLSALEPAKRLLPQEEGPIAVTKALVSLPGGQETVVDMLVTLPDHVLRCGLTADQRDLLPGETTTQGKCESQDRDYVAAGQFSWFSCLTRPWRVPILRYHRR